MKLNVHESATHALRSIPGFQYRYRSKRWKSLTWYWNKFSHDSCLYSLSQFLFPLCNSSTYNVVIIPGISLVDIQWFFSVFSTSFFTAAFQPGIIGKMFSTSIADIGQCRLNVSTLHVSCLKFTALCEDVRESLWRAQCFYKQGFSRLFWTLAFVWYRLEDSQWNPPNRSQLLHYRF